MDNRNAIGFRISVKVTAKAARQARQVCVVQRLLRSGRGLPPHPETAGAMSHAEKRIQYDPIHTIVAAGQQSVSEGSSLCHLRRATQAKA
jgi:hypothetical protein